MADVRARAQATIKERYELSTCLKKHIKLIKELAGGKLPTPQKPIKAT